MHRITLLSVGTVKTSWIREGCETYAERLRHSCDFSERVLKAGDAADEHKKILEALETVKGTVVLLDERGTERTSKTFAEWLGQKRDTGEPLTFVLGGAFGVNDAIRAKAHHCVALSAMTFPHELCKLVFMEQLYRAHTILEGRGYHH